MRLLFDIGNTRIKWVLEQQGDLIASDSCNNDELESVDLPDVTALDSVWVSCVGQRSVLQRLQTKVEKTYQCAIHQAQVAASACGIENAYHAQDKLGVDRWLAVIGARSMVAAGDLIVIDAGTAVNIEWLSANNIYQGGVILPGAEIMHRALVGRTAGIDSVRSTVESVVGKTTMECVNSGVNYGLAGAVERIVSEMQHVIVSETSAGQPPTEGLPARVLVTGGDAPLLLANTSLSTQPVANLVLHGLAQVARDGV